MKLIFNTIGYIIAAFYWVLIMPILFLLCVFGPIVVFISGVKVILSNYTVSGGVFEILMCMLFLFYFSLRMNKIRKIYLIFPWLYEFLKYSIVAYAFIGIGQIILNWSYIEINPKRRLLGIVCFILSIVIWRIVISISKYKNPLVELFEEKIQKYKNEGQQGVIENEKI
ncbi:MAG: hypothetical protein ACREV6_15635 [Clostridium sp.]|uniref:hypothetical protein n=1 Tax=Clostridium sp. TaxID=1506 RepID=UPI003D6D890E